MLPVEFFGRKNFIESTFQCISLRISEGDFGRGQLMVDTVSMPSLSDSAVEDDFAKSILGFALRNFPSYSLFRCLSPNAHRTPY